MHVPALWPRVEAVDARLGDPSDPRNALSTSRCLDLDERDAFPAEAVEQVSRAGVSDFYVPQSEGGCLDTFPELFGVFRAVARRDLTVAIAHHITFAAAVHVWAAGAPEQRRKVAAYVRGGGLMALAYHEKAHGSDVLATETSAVLADEGYRLEGEKWFVNNATMADVQTVFARTTPSGGPRGFSLFLVDKREMPAGAVEHLPRLKTHGARGADFSGVRFHAAPLGPRALIGRAGEGLELTLRAFQVTRAVIPALSLGAADAALRMAVAFARDRLAAQRTVFAIPRVRRQLAEAFADLLACECVVVATARGLHLMPSQMRLGAALCKGFVPPTIGQVLDRLGEVLGARSFLREERFASFQKILRDHRALPMFHAGGFMLLQTVALGMVQLAIAHREVDSPRSFEALERQFAFDQPLVPFDWSALQAYARPSDPLAALDRVEQLLHDRSGWGGVEPEVLSTLGALVAALQRVRRADAQTCAALRSRSAEDPPELFDLAERYCALHAAAACVLAWAQNRRWLDPCAVGGHWVALALSGLLRRLHVDAPVPAAVSAAVAVHLERLYLEHRAFSLVPSRLPGAAPLPGGGA